jgi:hypothetical protein
MPRTAPSIHGVRSRLSIITRIGDTGLGLTGSHGAVTANFDHNPGHVPAGRPRER